MHEDDLSAEVGQRGGPLTGLRVLDCTDGVGGRCAGYLGDLGADVVRVEPPGGGRSRQQIPVVDGISLHFLTHNANKRGIELDPTCAPGRALFGQLLDRADVVVVPGPGSWLEPSGLTPAGLRTSRPGLVVVSISDFGLTGPYRDWAATEQVQLALGGVLSRSGAPAGEPLLPPGSMALETASMQAAWAALLAHAQRLRTGVGDLVDVSVFESTAGVVDPGFGIAGSAAGGVPSADWPRGRPAAAHLYPIFACADGFVRITILAARQWAGMFRWLGEPPELADPALAVITHRFAAADLIEARIAGLLAGRGRSQVVAEGQAHGVPVAALLRPDEVLREAHFAVRGVFADQRIPAGSVRVVDGLIEVDGRRAGIRRPPPEVGQHTAEVLADWLSERPPDPRPAAEDRLLATNAPVPAGAPRRPLDGVRVLDLGVIVIGAELGRLLADMGAEVVKLETRAFPDGSRQSHTGAAMTASFAYGHRNKRGLGLNLRDERGRALFLDLVDRSDVVLSNFKPGTLEALGLGPADLLRRNPRLVVADSSAFGASGPWSRQLGYGPLVRASSGLTWLWRSPGEPAGFRDTSTIYPDHVSARVAATAVLAKLLQRRSTARGGTVSLAQIEVILGGFATALAQESLRPGSIDAVGNDLPGDAPRGVFRCAGDDEWVVVTVRGDADWGRLAAAIGRPDLGGDPALASAAGRVAARGLLSAALGAWTGSRLPRSAMTELQAAGVPAAMMQRIIDFKTDPQLRARGFLRDMLQPGVAAPMPAESAPAVFAEMPLPELRPAPLPGQQTAEIVREVLGLSEAEIADLLAAGVLEQTPADPATETTAAVTTFARSAARHQERTP